MNTISSTPVRPADTSHIRVSFEFFPPASEAARDGLWACVEKLAPLRPHFVSVTYGAGGSTRERTHKTVKRIVRDTDLSVAAHLTCVGASRDTIDDIARSYWDAGVRHVVALRGDAPGGPGSAYAPQADGYAYASDLVAGLKAIADFDISVAAYPEKHPESASWTDEIDNLKRKVDAGADRAITQFFFSADTYLRYLDRVRAAGIDIPVIPGLMLQPNYRGLTRMADLCQVDIPGWYHDLFGHLDDDPQTRLLLTASTHADLVSQLWEQGVRDFHFYTLNKPDLAFTTCQLLGLRPPSGTLSERAVS